MYQLPTMETMGGKQTRFDGGAGALVVTLLCHNGQEGLNQAGAALRFSALLPTRGPPALKTGPSCRKRVAACCVSCGQCCPFRGRVEKWLDKGGGAGLFVLSALGVWVPILTVRRVIYALRQIRLCF